MSALIPYIAIITLLTALVLMQGRKWVTKRDVILHAALVIVILALAADPMGRAKPPWAEWRNLNGMRISAAQYHPGEAIYIWTVGPPPRVYVLPWDAQMARRTQQTMEKGQAVLYQDGFMAFGVRPIVPPEMPEKESPE